MDYIPVLNSEFWDTLGLIQNVIVQVLYSQEKNFLSFLFAFGEKVSLYDPGFPHLTTHPTSCFSLFQKTNKKGNQNE